MKNANIKFEQHSIALGGDDCRTNHLVVIEIQNGKPINTYLVNLYNFLFWDEKMLYYVINQN
jgi:hypothetical protein